MSRFVLVEVSRLRRLRGLGASLRGAPLAKLAPAALIAVAAGTVLAISSFDAPRHHDEDQDAWGGYYITGRVLQLDFGRGRNTFTDPGWSSSSYWSLTQPMGVRWIEGVTMRAGGLQPPSRPYSYTDRALQGPETATPKHTLRVLRLVAAFLAALGLGLLSVRFGWKAWLASVALLATEDVRFDLSRAWSEGPLLFGFGLCAVTYGRRWFAPVLGLAASLKLTAMGLWPFLLVRGSAGSFSRLRAAVVTLLVWTILNPQSWLAGGPAYLVGMWGQRFREWRGQSNGESDPLGFYFPSRYRWPLELVLILLIGYGLEQLFRRWRAHRVARQVALPDTPGT